MAVTEWAGLCRRSLLKRTIAGDFVAQVQRRDTLDKRALLTGLIACRQALCPPSDPLPPRYLDALFVSRLISPTDVLLVLVGRWNGSGRTKSQVAPYSADVATLQEMAIMVASSRLVPSEQQCRVCLALCSKWLAALVKAAGSTETGSISNLVETVGSLLATLAASKAGVELLSQMREEGKSAVTDVVGTAVQAVLNMFPTPSTQLLDRLGEVQKHITMFTQSDASSLRALQFQQNVPQLQMGASRAGTMALLQHLLSTGRTVDDNVVFDFLAGRHANDFSSMFLDIVYSSFQNLSLNTGLALQQCELYIRNRLPVLLETISQSSFETFPAESALRMAWSQLDLSSSILPHAHRFLHVCSLHNLISSDKAIELIGDEQVLVPFTKTLHTKDDLVNQLTGNQSKVSGLVEEMLTSEGNGVVIAQAIVEIIVAYSHNKDTHHLKDLANTFVKKPAAINALALFLRPAYWITPLCTLLDDWRWEDIHGESQPLYDEFGSILLLILITKRRLSHSDSELGIKGFAARYLDQEGVSKPVSQLTEEAHKQLGEWISAFYIAEGLGDDLTTSCSPHDFYTLVPTLVAQSVLAHQSGKLTTDALQAGMEYLLEPFLMPSLVSAITWAMAEKTEDSTVLSLFTKSTDNAVHQTIVSMTQAYHEFIFEKASKMSLQTVRTTVSAAVTSPATKLSLWNPVATFGSEAVLKTLLDVLLDFSGSNDFLYALDLIATLVCVSDLREALQVRHANIGPLLKRGDTLRAEATVHLYRRVEAYSSVLVAQDIPMNVISLPNVDAADGNANTMNDQDHGVDDIDQVLNESAAMNAMDGSIDAALQSGLEQDDPMDSFYIPDDNMDNMGLSNLDDLDLDMF